MARNKKIRLKSLYTNFWTNKPLSFSKKTKKRNSFQYQGLLGLWSFNFFLGEKKNANSFSITFREFTQSLLSPIFLIWTVSGLKKGNLFYFWRFYGRFRSAKNSKAKPMIIITIMAMTAGTKYALTIEAGAGVGVGVAEGAFCTVQ